MFVMPIARGDGFMTLMLQHTVSSSNVVDLCCTRQFSHTSFAQNNTCMITDLDSYRRLQHLAPPMLYLTHYEELAEAPNTRLPTHHAPHGPHYVAGKGCRADAR